MSNFDGWLKTYEPIADDFWTLEDIDNGWQAATAAERERWIRECVKRGRRLRSLNRRDPTNTAALEGSLVLGDLQAVMEADDGRGRGGGRG